MIGQPYVLLWSERLNDIKVQTMEACMSETRQAYADKTPGDWRLMLVGNKVEVHATADSIRPTLRARALPGQFPATNSAEAA